MHSLDVCCTHDTQSILLHNPSIRLHSSQEIAGVSEERGGTSRLAMAGEEEEEAAVPGTQSLTLHFC